MRTVMSGLRDATGSSALRAALACLGALLVALGVDLALGRSVPELTREGGSVETCSALFYLAALAALAVRGGLARSWPVAGALAAMSAREFDADKRFTSEGLLSVKAFTRDTAPWEMLLALAVQVALAVIVVALLWRVGSLVAALGRGRAWAWWTAAALALTVVSKSIDGLGRKLAPLGVTIGEAVSQRAGHIEEVMELGIPVCLLLAILLRPPKEAA